MPHLFDGAPYRIGECVFADSADFLPPTPDLFPPYHGERDRPLKQRDPLFIPESDSKSTDGLVARAGFTSEGVVHFWNFNQPGSRLKYVWDSAGHLVMLVFNGNLVELNQAVVWARDREYFQIDIPAIEESSCPLPDVPISSGDKFSTWPSSMDDSSGSSASSESSFLTGTPFPLNPTSGCLVRAFALEGSYGHAHSSFESSRAPGDNPSSDYRCSGHVKTRFRSIVFDCSQAASSAADELNRLGLGIRASEIALRFDSAGHLMKVYFGGRVECEENPCVWDRDNPPEGCSLVVVPVLQLIFDTQLDKFRILLWVFDSAGHYVRTLHYATLCNCKFKDEPSSGDCVKFDICLTVEGGCSVATCPTQIEVEARVAYKLPCDEFSSEVFAASSEGGSTVVYTWGGSCCLDISSSSTIPPGPPPEGGGESSVGSSDVFDAPCFYAGELSGS